MTVNPGEASCAALPTAAGLPPQVALRYRRTVEPEAALPLISGLLSLAGESGSLSVSSGDAGPGLASSLIAKASVDPDGPSIPPTRSKSVEVVLPAT